MLWLTCRDFQVEFWSFDVRNCVKCVEICMNVCLLCTVNVQLSDRCTSNVKHSRKDFLLKLSEVSWNRGVMICFTWNVTFYAVLSVPYTFLTDFRLKQVLKQETVQYLFFFSNQFKCADSDIHIDCNKKQHSASHIYVLLYRFYTFYCTHFQISNWHCKGVKLPSGCVVPGLLTVYSHFQM